MRRCAKSAYRAIFILALMPCAAAQTNQNHTESSIEGAAQEQYEVGRAAWQVAGGTEFKLWGGFYAFGEYKFTRSKQRGKVSAGTAQPLLHHGVFGLSYHF